MGPQARGSRPGQAIESHDACVLVADADGELVGFCTGYQDLHSVRFGYRVWVEDLAVDPNHRSRGVGKALLDAAKSWARERGATHLELDSAEARTDAHRFYEREGAGDRSICFGWDLELGGLAGGLHRLVAVEVKLDLVHDPVAKLPEAALGCEISTPP